MDNPIKNKTAIVGIGQSEFSKRIGRSELILGLEVTKAAVEEAGLRTQDIDAIILNDMQDDNQLAFARNLGCRDMKFWSGVGWGGGAVCGMMAQAAMAITCGMAETVMVLRSRHRGPKENRPWAHTQARVQGPWAFEVPYGCIRPSDQIAMFVRRHMYLYGTTSLQYGAIAVAHRKHATTNPAAMMRKPITLEDHQSSRMISEPLHLLDCGLETDGASCAIITSAERAKSLKQKPVYITAAVQACGPEPSLMSYWYRPEELGLHARYAAKRLWPMAGITTSDIDVAMIYDVFTPLIVFQLEEYGFCKAGEGGPFVEGGRIEWPDGDLPVNTHGGSLSEAYVHGMNHVFEAVKQLRGTAINQVKDAEVVMVTSGPPVPTSAMILRR